MYCIYRYIYIHTGFLCCLVKCNKICISIMRHNYLKLVTYQVLWNLPQTVTKKKC